MSLEMSWRVMGVDPGVNGAIATLDPKNLTLLLDSMPVIKTKRKSGRAVTLIDIDELGIIIRRHAPGRAVLEEVGARPDEGAVSAFSFGRTLGRIESALCLSGVHYDLVKPAVWKRETKTPADKEGAVARADRLFPLCRKMWRGPRGGLQHDRAEAAIMALYGLVVCGVPPGGAFKPEVD